MEKVKIEKIADTLYTLSKFEFDIKQKPNTFLTQSVKKDFDQLVDEVVATRENIFLSLTEREFDYIKSVLMSRRIVLLRNYKDWCFVGNQKKLEAYKNDAVLYQNLINELQQMVMSK